MDDRQAAGEYLLDNLKERAKELNCLYKVDEILNNPRLSLAEIFTGITRVMPSGWQFPEQCQARIVYAGNSYQTPGFKSSPISLSADIKISDKITGTIEVIYTHEVPKAEDDYFLEKEIKLINTIADRIGQSIFKRHMEQVWQEWNTSRNATADSDVTREWMVMVDILSRTDPHMLLHICRKMINHLYLSGIQEAAAIFGDFSSGWQGGYAGEVNYPSEKQPRANIEDIRKKTFHLAAHHLSDAEISVRLKQWIQEEKAYPLIRAVDRLDASVKEIVNVVSRYSYTAQDNERSYFPLERWLVVALIQRFLSEKMDFIVIARQYLEISDFSNIVSRLIFPEGSHGKIGGKATGLFLAQQIIEKAAEDQPLLKAVKVPKTWYITTDESKEFIHYNHLEDLNVQKYKELYEIRLDYPNIIQILKNSELPPGVVKSLAMALDDFGDVPLIVRSSSLLEDQLGAAFAGKYKSLFLANQGSKQERLQALMGAIVEVYASIYSPDSIQYRAERGLLDFNEEMGILIQEVVGCRIGPYYLPLYAGVGFSQNEFRWSPRIKRQDGLLRLVMGLGTRAVDRLSDDFPVLVSPGQPQLRVNKVPDEIKRYSPQKVDVINLEKDTFETVEINELIRTHGDQVPHLQKLFSIYREDYIKKPLAFEVDCRQDDLLLTFDGLISDTPFIRQIYMILTLLQDKLGTAVDIEFASDGENFYLLQCRPQCFGPENAAAPIPKDIPSKDIVFSAQRYIANGTISDISHIVYVRPEGYNRLPNRDNLLDVARAVGKLNLLLPRRRFLLMGPGRWGSRGDIKMGVPVSYADIYNTAALIEIARQKSNYLPELSFGTHFFQDLVEADIRYLPLYPDDPGIEFNERFLDRCENILTRILPEFSYLDEVVRVIDVPANTGGNILMIAMNADLNEALGYLAPSSPAIQAPYAKAIIDWQEPGETYSEDRYWRWRFHMAEKIAAHLDLKKLAVKGIYLFGSTNHGTAGPGSDIDLLIHFQGDNKQYEELMHWLKGWSQCLAEINYLKTGYNTEELLDIHIVTDQDIANQTAFAMKINSPTDPAYPLIQIK
ncbi:Pyruvate phosphate dikinase, PEP/pyruvate-binding [Syntrophomonas zehnderi OL-4]|uniref:Phosphoenolpyruvate synthase n=1 Tax=Syntrophomonas zehnderi OL-4 TaxID=690567 RepID=A0A0E4G9N9_9FIRM|nr:PEP/pyruvate-binding domain-containing protein [Syntrophomonas zehnderi]CFX09890.1 Pyruvate phosphate dikinase, PEP/pyruvate-binding [Syntrophomonas zehnderi OL-4]